MKLFIAAAITRTHFFKRGDFMAATAVQSRMPEAGETLKIGHKDVTTAGTQVALAAVGNPCYEVMIQAKRTNTGRIYIGGSTIENNDQGGLYLTAGQSVTITSQFLSDIWINSSIDAEGVTYLYW